MTDRWSATERIFHAALEQPPAARAAFLAEACGDDSALRRDVQSLLDEASSTGFLAQPALHVAAGLVTSASSAPLTGQHLGVYSITSLVGRGGMGEVYRARDTRLGRDVAIKVLPPALTTDPDRLARFEREARVLASLNHPHIGMLHGLEESGGHRALILELVEGETLAERLARGRVPLKIALGWARQIADALDAAHEKGIVHRDLKPANIKITPQDVIKVLDFGLARTSAEGAAAGEGPSPTITVETGLIIGTAAYMSPEQARGQVVDRRSDVWAFGCVLYELLTRKVAFGGATVPDILSAVLHQEPDWAALPADVPLGVTTLVRRCLDKDARRRRRDIGDVRAELDEVLAQPAASHLSNVTERRAPARRALRMTVAAAVVIAAAALGATASWWSFGAPSGSDGSSEPRHKRITDAIGVEEMPAISPDGKDVAFVAAVNGHRQIWIRRLTGGGQALQVTRDEVDHDYPRWTPESSAIVYFTPPLTEGDAGTLSEIPALGGAPRRLAASSTGADVSHDGRWLATFQKTATGLALTILTRDGVTSGEPIPIETDAVDYYPPRWSPNDRSIAFFLGTPIVSSELFVIDLSDRTPRRVSRANQIKGVAWLPSGDGLVFASAAGSTMVYPPVFNLRLVSRDGGGERQLTFGDVSHEQPDLIRGNQLFATSVVRKSDIWRFPVSGSPAENVQNGFQVTRQTGQVQTPTVSPDGQEIAYLSDSGGHSNVWVTKIDGSENPRPLTSEDNARVVVGIPIWSPVDGRIVFITNAETDERDRRMGEWLINRDGSGRRLLVRGSSAAWSPDGQWLYYQTETPRCIYKILVDRTEPPVRVRCDANVPAPAPDGTLYFAPGGWSKANEIYKAKPEGDETATLVARFPKSRVPLWPIGFAVSPDGRWIAMALKDRGTTNIWAIPTDGGPYRQLTDFEQRPILIARQVSWSRDGKFIYAALAESDADIVLLEGLIASKP
jgi:serine/threonine protein kinase/Tol biopolymer transport system component